ncbi:MAG: diphthine synthase [Acidilobaceae archaeon]
MTLILAGCGLHPGSFTRDLLEALEDADTIYVETYTMPSSSWVLHALNKWISKVRITSRKLVEENSRLLIEEAKSRLIVVLSTGDPLIATTHQALLAEAISAGVEVRYIPGVSGVCIAKAFSGLQYYRFGRTTTIPGPWRGFKPYSILAFIYGNLCIDLHTLLLLDISDDGTQLKPQEGARTIIEVEVEAESVIGYKGTLRNTPALVLEATGTPQGRIIPFNSLEELMSSNLHIREPSSIAIPAPLNKTEKWILEALSRSKLGEIWLTRTQPRRYYCDLYEKIIGWLSSPLYSL